MLKTFKLYRLLIFILLCAFFFVSCTLTRPLSLKPFNNTTVQKLEAPDLSKFNGEYDIISKDTSITTLDYIFISMSKYDLKKLPGRNDYMRLTAIDNRRIKASLFLNNKIVRTKTIKGHLTSDYFEFHTAHLMFRLLLNVFIQQSTRLALSKEGDLFADNNHGGGGFLVILPIPLSFSSFDEYNLKFKRKASN